MRSLIDSVKAACRVSTPLIGLTTSDQPALLRTVKEALGDERPQLAWDAARGIRALNDAGRAAIEALGGGPDFASDTQNPQSALEVASRLPRSSALYMLNAHRFVGDAFVSSWLLALRDLLKRDFRTCFLLAPSFSLPTELSQDVMILDDPMPNDERLMKISATTHAAAKLPENEAQRSAVVSAVRGLSAFQAEQVIAMSLRKEGLDIEACWDSKRAAINQTRGLTITMGGPTFDGLGGLEQAVLFGRRRFAGPEPPAVIVHIDEIEKQFAAAETDSTGISQDFNQCFLKTMENEMWDGMLLAGHPGGGKSMFAQALAATHGIPRIEVDLGSMKDSLVGNSEQAIRAAIRVIKGVGGNRVFVVGTCNDMGTIPTPLRRRFISGIWFFDLPTAQEREAIWKVQLPRFGHALDAVRPPDANWTGAEIRNCCRAAYMLGMTLVEASQFVLPIATSDPVAVERLRKSAEGKWFSATKPGHWKREGEAAERMIDLEDTVTTVAVMQTTSRPSGVQEVPVAPPLDSPATPPKKKIGN